MCVLLSVSQEVNVFSPESQQSDKLSDQVELQLEADLKQQVKVNLI